MNIPLDHPLIEMVKCRDLRPNRRNARKHSPKQLQQIAASIQRFGFVVPLVVNDDRVIAAGHGRWEAAKILNLEEVPVIRVDFLTDEDFRAFALAENRLAELSEWDQDLLSEELNDLFERGYDFGVSGFDVADLDFVLRDVETPQMNAKHERIDLPDPDVPVVTRDGDLWVAGPHRVLCGDARSLANWETLLGQDRADMVFADLPYNLRIDGFVSGNGRVRHRDFLAGAGELSRPEFTAFLRDIFRHSFRFSRGGAIHYLCMDWRHIREILDAADGIYDQFKQLIVWVKNNGGQGAFYRSRHELIFVFKCGKVKHINNFGLGDNGRYRTNVVEYAGCNTFRKGRKADLSAHSTVKPTAMIADFMLDCSNRGDLIVDPCLGSGTTTLAAHRTGRRAAGMELDPAYVDTALRRLAADTGLTPTLAGDGRSFAEIAACRRPAKED